MPSPKYRACCLVCYTTELTKPTTKKAANMAATSHQGQFHHEVVILEVKKEER